MELWPACGSGSHRAASSVGEQDHLLVTLGAAGSPGQHIRKPPHIIFICESYLNKMKTNTWEVEWFYPERWTELDLQWLPHPPHPWKLYGPSGSLWAPSTPSPQTAQSLREVRVRWDWEKVLFYPFHRCGHKESQEDDSLFSKFCVLHDLIVSMHEPFINFPAFPNPMLSIQSSTESRMTFSTPTVFYQ